MTPKDAARIVTLLTGTFHRDAIEAETLALFVKRVASLDDYEAGIVAADELARAQDHFPTIREYLDAYHAVARRRAGERSDSHGLERAKAGPPPEFVHVWWWARHTREPAETRYLPQMVDPDTGLPFGQDEYMPLSEYEQLADEWRAAGAPRLGFFGALVASVGQD